MASLEDLLERTSRTFALTIPLLEEPLRRQVTIAYLLFRIADTLEDADLLGRDDRVALLQRFGGLLQGERTEAMRVRYFVEACRKTPPTADADCKELLAASPEVFAALDATGAAASDVRRHLTRTVGKMVGFVKRADEKGALALRDARDLREYCYAVAGIVGEMLCDLVVRDEPKLAAVRGKLDSDAGLFGEGLQLVNILKDADADAKQGRVYVPRDVPRVEVFELATEDLEKAKRYLRTLHAAKARRGTLAFHALPVRLAVATLEAIKARGAGAKVSREDVAREVMEMNADLDRGGSGLGQ